MEMATSSNDLDRLRQVCLFGCLFHWLFVCLFICLYVCLFGWLVSRLVGCLFVCLFVVNCWSKHTHCTSCIIMGSFISLFIVINNVVQMAISVVLTLLVYKIIRFILLRHVTKTETKSYLMESWLRYNWFPSH